jgi:hypothetical protein
VVSNGQAAIWARLADWVRVEGDLPEPRPGSVLAHKGIRLYGGTVELTDDAGGDGLTAQSYPSDDDPRTPVYVATARVEHVNGLELVLNTGNHRLQAQVDRFAQDVRIGAHVAVQGELFVIGEYEWESFPLVDTRGDWMITDTINQPDGDFLVLLTGLTPR